MKPTINWNISIIVVLVFLMFGAGESRTHPVQFAVPPDAGPVRIMVSWGGLDYLIPGPQNPLVQRRASLAVR